MTKLIDRFGRHIEYVRLSLTEACNFACPYCRPQVDLSGLTKGLAVKEWMPILEAFHELGIRAVRLTGGEPLLYPHLEELLQEMTKKRWFEDISLTTNGSLLAEKAEMLKRAGAHRVNVSLDALTEESFRVATGGYGNLEEVKEGIFAAHEAGLGPIKVNTVLSRSYAEEEVASFLALMEEWPVIWRFIEYMPFQGKDFRGPTFSEWKGLLEKVAGKELQSVSFTEGFGPASYYAFEGGKKIGFIFPMTHSYCDSCNRLRVTSDGRLRLCLLRKEEVPLWEGAGDTTVERVKEKLIQAVATKEEEHEGYDSSPEKEMFRIGG